MASYAELLQTCTDFQKNFSVLNGKYNVLSQELHNEQERSKDLKAKLDASFKESETLQGQIRALEGELVVASEYKDRYITATVSLEHLKGRLENARHAISETLLEHDQEVAQLKTQINDLLKRIDVVADGTRVRELTKQVTELEEKCAFQSAQLLEEKEQFTQQLITAHQALQEQQSRNLELEQRYHAMEDEISELRGAVRRSLELQKEAVGLKERYASETESAQREVYRLNQEVESLQRKLEEKTRQYEEDLRTATRSATKDRNRLNARIDTLSEALNDMTVAVTEEHDKYTNLQCSMQQQVHRARDEAAAEVMALQASLQQARDDLQHAQWQAQRLEEELGKSRRTAQEQQIKYDALFDEKQQLEAKLAAAAQQEAWLTVEKAYNAEQLAAARQQLDNLAPVLKKYNELSFDADKMRLRIEMQEEELAELHRDAKKAQSRLEDIKEAADKKILNLNREAKAYKKQAMKERATGDSLRRKLVRAVAEGESARRHCGYAAGPRRGSVGEAMQPHFQPPCDVIELLKNQNEQAELLHNRLVELSR